MTSHRCIVNVAVCQHPSQWFGRGQDRLEASLDALYPGAWYGKLWRNMLPPGSPTHAEAPYAFKTFAIQAAIDAGYTSVLWLDASMWAVRDLEPLWAEIESKGTTFLRSGFSIGSYATDEALSILGLSRDEAMSVSLVAGGIYGLDLTHEGARAFQRQMLDYATDRRIFLGAWDNTREQCSEDSRCKGHRHDMVPMAHLVSELGLHIVNPPRFWALPPKEAHEGTQAYTDFLASEKIRETLILARGM